ncbi:Pheromone biosynthesis activating neuropeptide (PBAN) [Popillia japonica]|uniref:Pheromone biosynthesis activating neuropeptide (PBAN) n=1 Tax=Popillia japonica TaxID=7064 RepID=A0AAW1NIL6_POPJA
MQRTIYFVFAFAVFFQAILAENNNEKSMEEYAKPKQSSPLWFGPRLGRKKRNQHLDDFDEFLSADCEQVEDYIRSIPWSMVEKCSLNEDKRDKPKSKQFSPRLGRESSEDMFGWSQNPDILTLRSPPFAPRLGRRVLPFTPRLGRETVVNY